MTPLSPYLTSFVSGGDQFGGVIINDSPGANVFINDNFLKDETATAASPAKIHITILAENISIQDLCINISL